MAHEIDSTTGKNAIAYVGATPWHGLGEKLDEGASIYQWVKAAGLNWDVRRAPVQYMNGEMHTIEDRHVLYRGDTGAHLGIVSDGYQIVQSVEVLEFFRELVETADFTLETAGSLFGGKRIFALAKMNREEEIKAGDKVGGYLLLSTSFDGGMATTAQFTSVRVVCNNTIRMADAENPKSKIKIPHSTKFREDDVKAALNIGHKRFDQFISDGRKLAEKMITDAHAEEMVKLMFKDRGGEDVTKSKAYKNVMDLFHGGAMGSNLDGVEGTSWGLLNAVTQYVDHEKANRSQDARLNSAWFGKGAAMKDNAFEILMADASKPAATRSRAKASA